MSVAKRKFKLKKNSGWVSKELSVQRKKTSSCTKDSKKFPGMLCSLPCEGTFGAAEINIPSCNDLGVYADDFVRMLVHSYATCTQVRLFQKAGVVSNVSCGTHYIPSARMYCMISENLCKVRLFDAACPDALAEISLKPYAQCSMSPESLVSLYQAFEGRFITKLSYPVRVMDHIIHSYMHLKKAVDGILTTDLQDISYCTAIEESGKYISNLAATHEQSIAKSAQRNLF